VTSQEEDIRALEALLASDEFAQLRVIAAAVPSFNLFDVASLGHREEVHTRLLSFLLDPRREHGLGDVFARTFTAAALGEAQRWEGKGFIVYREWPFSDSAGRGRIDLLLVDYDACRALIIENKIRSGEHGDQLSRYWQAIQQRFGHLALTGIFLSIAGSQPSDSRYTAVNYKEVCAICEGFLTNAQLALLPETRDLLGHYVQLLRRDFVGENDEVRALCHRIFREHPRALKLLLANQPDPDAQLHELLRRCLSEPSLYVFRDRPDFGEISAVPQSWLQLNGLQAKQAEYHEWLLFFVAERLSKQQRAVVRLYLERVPRTPWGRLYEHAAEYGEPFRPFAYNERWDVLYEHTLLRADEYQLPQEQREPLVLERWQGFVDGDLPRLTDVFAELLAGGAEE
jgi:hypothetical protein